MNKETDKQRTKESEKAERECTQYLDKRDQEFKEHFMDFLGDLRRVSNAHFIKYEMRTGRKTWSIYEQILHTQSEVSELYEALRPVSYDRNVLNHIIVEIWDIVFSAITNAHVIGLSDDFIFEGMLRTLRKIERRMIENKHNPAGGTLCHR